MTDLMLDIETLSTKPTALIVWGKGAGFDAQILASAYQRIGMAPPWHYRAPRDLRTLLDVAGMLDQRGLVVDEPRPSHNALQDAKDQARLAQQAFARMRARSGHVLVG